MATTEENIEKLENKFEKIQEKQINTERAIDEKLLHIQETLVELSTLMKGIIENGDLKNKLLKEEIDRNTERIEETNKKLKKIEEAKDWLVKLVFGSIVGMILEAVAFYIKLKP